MKIKPPHCSLLVEVLMKKKIKFNSTRNRVVDTVRLTNMIRFFISFGLLCWAYFVEGLREVSYINDS